MKRLLKKFENFLGEIEPNEKLVAHLYKPHRTHTIYFNKNFILLRFIFCKDIKIHKK